jgi:hypothetical protein
VALLGNYSVLHKSPAKFMSGQTASGDRANWNKPGMLRSRGVGTDGGWKQVAVPLGFTDGGAWLYPKSTGGMVLRGDGEGGLFANLVPTRAMTIDLTGQGSLSAAAALVVSMLCAMTGSGALQATCAGLLNMTTNFTGSGGLSSSLNGVASMLASLTGSGNLTAVIAAIGNMEIDITVTGTGLSTANIGPAVWGAFAALNNDPGTMGQLLNAVSAGGLSPTQQALLEEIHRRLGLDPAAPLTTTPTSIVAGDIDMTITGDGETTSTVTRQ